MEPFQITVYTKDGCTLCEYVKEKIQTVSKDYPIEMRLFDITADDLIFEKYKWVIPVVHIDGEEVFVSKMAELWLRRELDKRMLEKSRP